MKYPLSTHLAILQQAEYDLGIYSRWLRSTHVFPKETLQSLEPENWTTKLKLVKNASSIFTLFTAREKAISLAVKSLEPLEWLARASKLARAKRHLRQLQKNGLTVIAVAGSYGKTSVKHSVRHLLSTQYMTAMSPASFNTPLGLAHSILQLTSDHNFFVAELGEYQKGDIEQLLAFLKPNIGILTPVGFAHGERFQSSEEHFSLFHELWDSEDAPEFLFIDDANRKIFSSTANIPTHAFWYGQDKKSDLQLKDSHFSLERGSGNLLFYDGTALSFTTNLSQTSQLRNTLPAFLIQQSMGQPIDTFIRALSYAPAVPRRLEVLHNLNGTVVIDNSYNTNPGAWKANLPLITSLCKSGLVLLTPGFVELSQTENSSAHLALANDLLKLDVPVGIIRTRFNEFLIEALMKSHSQEKTSLFIGDSYDDLLKQLSQKSIRFTYLWLEGGVRELYQ